MNLTFVLLLMYYELDIFHNIHTCHNDWQIKAAPLIKN